MSIPASAGPPFLKQSARKAQKWVVWLLAALFMLTPVLAAAQSEDEGKESVQIVSFTPPKVALAGVPFEQTIEAGALPEAPVVLEVAGETYELKPDAFSAKEDGIGATATVEEIVVPETGNFAMTLSYDGETVQETEGNAISGFWSIAPALIAIAMALLTRQVIPSLFLGIFLGAWMTYGLSLPGLWYGLLDTAQVYALEALVPPDGSKSHMQIIVFTLMMGGLIGIIYRNGGAHAIADKISSLASNRSRGQAATSGLGFAIFFSTYANSLIVGNTMRPVTDKLKISREKLAYIVDSTAAPLASIAIISTWIGYQLGLIEDATQRIGFDEGAYSIFLSALPYNFYPILALVMVWAVALTGRDFGPMLKAERRAYHEGKVTRDGADVDDPDEANDEGLTVKEGVPHRAINALIPIGVLIATVAIGLYVTGEGETLREIIGSAEGNKALTWAGILGVLSAVLLSIGQRILTLSETMEAWFEGLKTVLFVMIILTLAWSLAAIAEDLHTANWLVQVLGDTIPPQFLPAILFVLSAAVSFAVGTSWGTMGILMPLAVPLIWSMMQNADMTGGEYHYILYATIGTILAGSVWGDHCSPISDTTIISSVASGSDHIDHVRTQIPYAMAVGFVSIGIGLIPTGFGIPWYLTLPAGAAVLIGGLWLFGSRVEDEETTKGTEEKAESTAATTPAE